MAATDHCSFPRPRGASAIAESHAGADGAPSGGEPVPADLAEEHLAVADALARRFRCRGHDPEDLRQVARLGLVKAATRYREELGHGFVPYAVVTIEGELKRHLRDQSWSARPSRPVLDLRLRARAATVRLEQRLGREPTLAELAQELGSSGTAVEEAWAADSALLTFSVELSDREDDLDQRHPAVVVACEEPGFDRVEDVVDLAAALKETTEEERELLRLRFGLELTQAQIARRLGTNQMSVSRSLRSLLRRLRQRMAA